jgi:MFS family permease
MGARAAQGKTLWISALLYGAGFALFGLAPNFILALALLAFVGATDSIWSAARSTMIQLITPEKFRGRMMGVFQLSNRGLHPLGQMETGLIVPLTFAGGVLVSLATLAIAWRVPEIGRFRWDQRERIGEDGISQTEPSARSTSTMPD